jgi:hypothetical protein
MVRARVFLPSQFLARPLSRSGEADLLSPADRLDMLDLIHTFGWCLDANAYDILATIITEDFTLNKSDAVIEGRDKFISHLKSNPEDYDYLRHQNCNALLRSVDLSHAIVVSYLLLTKCAPANHPGGVAICDLAAQGVCVDHLKKEKEIWKLQRRMIDQIVLSERQPSV